MTLLHIHQVDAFTDTIFAGNPTAIITNAETLSDAVMKKIANEMNFSETGFILASKKADIRLRYFTPPGNEILFCGHATVGALMALFKEKRFDTKSDKIDLSIETNAQVLQARIDATNKNKPLFSFDLPEIALTAFCVEIDLVRKALDISENLIDCSKAPMLEETNRYLFLAAPSLDALKEISINVETTRAFCKEHNIVLICILTPESFNPTHHVHTRAFAPLVGVIEDPFTGSMQGGVVAYLRHHNQIPHSLRKIVSEQGHFIKRPGKASIEITNDNPLRARLHAEATHVFATTMTLPE